MKVRLTEPQRKIIESIVTAPTGRLTLADLGGNTGGFAHAAAALQKTTLRLHKNGEDGGYEILAERAVDLAVPYPEEITGKIQKDAELKEHLAGKVADRILEYLPDTRPIVFFDGGSQAGLCFRPFFQRYRDSDLAKRGEKLTVVTTNPMVATEVMSAGTVPGVELVVLEGRLSFDEVTFIAPSGMRPICDQSIDVAVLGCSRMNTSGGLGLPDDRLLEQKIALIAASTRLIIPITESKVVEACTGNSKDLYPPDAMLIYHRRSPDPFLVRPPELPGESMLLSAHTTIGRILESNSIKMVDVMIAYHETSDARRRERKAAAPEIVQLLAKLKRNFDAWLPTKEGGADDVGPTSVGIATSNGVATPELEAKTRSGAEEEPIRDAESALRGLPRRTGRRLRIDYFLVEGTDHIAV